MLLDAPVLTSMHQCCIFVLVNIILLQYYFVLSVVQ